jgi:DNA-binding XRE family transcriptional regulator/DNA-binding Xre family transcriptional regulator
MKKLQASTTMRKVDFDNRRKTLYIEYNSGKLVEIHYGQLGIHKKISEVWIDRETGGRSVGIRFTNGDEEFMPYDQPLALARDPEFLLRTHLERILGKIRLVLHEKRISKHYLAEQLETSDNQIQRLLNPAFLNKNLEQLYRIGILLGLEFEWNIKKAMNDAAGFSSHKLLTAEESPLEFERNVSEPTTPSTALRMHRKLANLTQRELAKKSGIPQPHIAAMESGKRPIGLMMAKKLALALGIDHHKLV